MRVKILILIFAFSIASCTAFGTKTLYKASEPIIVKNVGFSRLQNAVLLSTVFYQTEQIFHRTVFTSLNDVGISDVTHINEEIDYDNPNIARIKELCRQQGIDAILLTSLHFLHVTYSVYGAAISQNYDTEVDEYSDLKYTTIPM